MASSLFRYKSGSFGWPVPCLNCAIRGPNRNRSACHVRLIQPISDVANWRRPPAGLEPSDPYGPSCAPLRDWPKTPRARLRITLFRSARELRYHHADARSDMVSERGASRPAIEQTFGGACVWTQTTLFLKLMKRVYSQPSHVHLDLFSALSRSTPREREPHSQPLCVHFSRPVNAAAGCAGPRYAAQRRLEVLVTGKFPFPRAGVCVRWLFSGGDLVAVDGAPVLLEASYHGGGAPQAMPLGALESHGEPRRGPPKAVDWRWEPLPTPSRIANVCWRDGFDHSSEVNIQGTGTLAAGLQAESISP